MNKQIQKAKQNYDLEKAAQLQYGELPKLQQQLEIEEKSVKKVTEVWFMRQLLMMRSQGSFPDGPVFL